MVLILEEEVGVSTFITFKVGQTVSPVATSTASFTLCLNTDLMGFAVSFLREELNYKAIRFTSVQEATKPTVLSFPIPPDQNVS